MVRDAGRTIWDVVAEQAERAPRQIAVSGERELSYQEVCASAAELSRRIATTAPPGSLVALDADAPRLGAIAILAAARAGCALLPLNRDSPPRHRAAVLADARPAALLVADGSDDDPAGLCLVEPDSGTDTPRTDLTGIAYVMFTSGSTGVPKGVPVSHTALIDRLAGLARTPGLAAGESMFAKTALSFDISMAEILLPLTVGGTVVEAPFGARLDPAIFARAVEASAPDVIQATPSFWRLALAAGWHGAPASRIWCGGEAMTEPLARDLLPAGKEVWNLYGPTEATIWASASRIEAGAPVSLGAPLSGTGISLVDRDDDGADSLIREPDRPGEILLYGAGLAEGYLDRAELTAERFRVGFTPDGPWTCYRTGDRARYRPDGSLEFLGRTDGQIKLRGHRIELGEIESVLEACGRVSEAVAVVRSAERPERAHIAAFVVLAPAAETGVSAETDTSADSAVKEIRKWSAERLPPSMRPAKLIITDALPRTAAGKIDRVRLSADGPPSEK